MPIKSNFRFRSSVKHNLVGYEKTTYSIVPLNLLELLCCCNRYRWHSELGTAHPPRALIRLVSQIKVALCFSSALNTKCFEHKHDQSLYIYEIAEESPQQQWVQS
jgi:hypothetical protein